MPTKELPEVIDLFERIEELLSRAVSFHGVMVRSVGTRFANGRDFFSGKGAAKFGGRWNRPGIQAV